MLGWSYIASALPGLSEFVLSHKQHDGEETPSSWGPVAIGSNPSPPSQLSDQFKQGI